MTIRAATVDDAAALCEAEQAIAATPGFLVSAPDELTPQAFRDRIAALQGRGLYLVAEVDGEPAGHVVLEPGALRAVAHVMTLTIAVHLGHQDAGLGRRLLQAALDWAQSRPEVGKVTLHVRATNQRAIHLYEAMGFVHEGRLVRKLKLPDGAWVDDLSMGWFPHGR